MKRLVLAACAALLASAASADDFADGCKRMGNGLDKLGNVVWDTFNANGAHGKYLAAVQGFGKSDLQAMQGFRVLLGSEERVDPLTGDKLDCTKVDSALVDLQNEYTSALDTANKATAPCTSRDDENTIKGGCGKAIKAAADAWSKMWGGTAKAYARAENSSAPSCRASRNGYGAFYQLGVEPGARKIKGQAMIKALKLNDRADRLKEAQAEFKKVKYQGLKAGVAGLLPTLQSLEKAYRTLDGTPTTGGRKLFETSIYVADAADKLKKLRDRVCVVVKVDMNNPPAGDGAGVGDGSGAGTGGVPDYQN